MPYKANEACRHKIPKARYCIKNCRAYDAALRDRGDLKVWVTPDAPEATAAWQPPQTGGRGRTPTYAEVAIETGVLLRSVARLMSSR